MSKNESYSEPNYQEQIIQSLFTKFNYKIKKFEFKNRILASIMFFMYDF